ncbi:MAG: hotdog domain-containing protein [bacterium]
MRSEVYKFRRLIKSQDLNHHGTLFAGTMSSWFVEACYIHAVNLTGKPENLVCLKLHGLHFSNPASSGSTVRLETTPVYAGRSSIAFYCRAVDEQRGNEVVDGFITFVSVDKSGRTMPHGIEIEEDNEHSSKYRRIKDSE